MGTAEKPSIKIVIATHIPYRMPEDQMYLPLHVGAEAGAGADEENFGVGFEKDNTGDNISSANPYFCELTGLYWAWKNLKYDYIGLVHYRRYFSMRKGKDKFSSLLTYNEIVPYLGKIQIFVPKKRKYYIETLYSHYGHTHYAEQLDKVREIIKQKYPAYLNSCNRVFKSRSGYMFNMLIMNHELLNEYCTWLFDILFTLKDQLNLTNLSDFQKRLFGRVSEILLNVWLDYQVGTGRLQKSDIKELPYIYTEKINWLQKGTAFLSAKLFGKKYEY